MELGSFKIILDRLRRAETYWGFPCQDMSGIEEDSLSQLRKTQKSQPSAPVNQRGVAMIIAIMVISMMFIFTADMMVNSAVTLQLAAAHRNNIKAEYLAKSGKNLALFVLATDLGLDLSMYQQSKKVPSDGSGDVWALLNGIPIGESTMKLMAASSNLKLSKVNDADVFSTLESFDGSFVINIVDEQSKLNVNYCAKGHGVQCMQMLRALMSCPAEKKFLEAKKLTPEEVAANIKDWVDSSASVSEGSKSSNEEDPYADRDPRIKPKNAPFDSLDELKLVAGWDEEMHAVFSPYLTIHPVQLDKAEVPKINVNTATVPMMSCLIPNQSDDCRQRSVISMMPAKEEDRLMDVSNRQGVQGRLRDVFCEGNVKRLDQFTYRSDVYRVNIKGEVGDQIRELELVIQRGFPDGIDKNNEFVGTYKFLEWKML